MNFGYVVINGAEWEDIVIFLSKEAPILNH